MADKALREYQGRSDYTANAYQERIRRENEEKRNAVRLEKERIENADPIGYLMRTIPHLLEENKEIQERILKEIRNTGHKEILLFEDDDLAQIFTREELENG